MGGLLRRLQSGAMRLTGAFMRLKDKFQKVQKIIRAEINPPLLCTYDSTRNSTSSARGGQARARTQIIIESQNGFIFTLSFHNYNFSSGQQVHSKREQQHNRRTVVVCCGCACASQPNKQAAQQEQTSPHCLLLGVKAAFLSCHNYS